MRWHPPRRPPSSPVSGHALSLVLFMTAACWAGAASSSELLGGLGVGPRAGPVSEQKPLHASGGGGGDLAGHDGPWQLDFTSAAPHLFASAYMLLQQWGNTFFPNGHAIAAVEVPAYTLFYHGRRDDEPPPSPEWLAFDLEMSYGIMGSTRDSWLLTYQTTRPVKCVYFDGESATLMGLGTMDTQMLHLFGNVSGPAQREGGGGDGGFYHPLGAEYLRAQGLCDWLREAGLRGAGWGFEGVVRMNAGFEIIWCDFTSPSLRLLSRLNVTAPLLPEVQARDRPGANEGIRLRNDKQVEQREDQGDQDEAEPDPKSYYSLPPVPTRTDKATDPTSAPLPPNMRFDTQREPFLQSQGWGWFESATWHYGSTGGGPLGAGETRARVLGCGVLSYYAPRFAVQARHRAVEDREALNLTADGSWEGTTAEDDAEAGARVRGLRELARRRRFHHLEAVTPEEAALMRNSSETALRRLLSPASSGSTGADWVLIAAEIVQRTAMHLKTLEKQIEGFPAEAAGAFGEDGNGALTRWVREMRIHCHRFLVGYLEYPNQRQQQQQSSSSLAAAFSPGSALFNETYSRCRYRYTRLLVPDEYGGPLASPEEEDLRWAVEETYGTVCRALITIGFEVEKVWMRASDNSSERDGSLSSSVPGEGELGLEEALRGKYASWRDQIAELVAWLGWEGEWVGCREACAADERCFIPMWPLLHWDRRRRGGGSGGRGGHRGGRRPEQNDTDLHAAPGGGEVADDDLVGNGYPDFKMPPRSRGSFWMGDDTDLWEPKCVNASYIFPG